MTHTTKIVEKKILSDGAIAVRVRCCGDSSTDSVTTIYIKPSTTEKEVGDLMQKHHDHVSKQHEALLRALELVSKI